MNPELVSLAWLALLPAGGMLCGALIAEWLHVSWRAMGAVLHAAAGVAIAVVSVELMPRILQDIATSLLVMAFAAGAAVSVLVVLAVRRVVRAFEVGSAGPWMVYLAVAVDLCADGLMVGIGSAVTSGLGLLLALSQVVANVPGGFAAVSNFRHKGVRRPIRLAAMASLFVPVAAAAAAGYLLLRGQGAQMQNAALAFVVGLLLLATVEDLVPQADEPRTTRWITTAAFATGFAFFTVLSLGFG